MFLLLTLNIFQPLSNVSIVDFEQVNVNWPMSYIQSLIRGKVITQWGMGTCPYFFPFWSSVIQRGALI